VKRLQGRLLSYGERCARPREEGVPQGRPAHAEPANPGRRQHCRTEYRHRRTGPHGARTRWTWTRHVSSTRKKEVKSPNRVEFCSCSKAVVNSRHFPAACMDAEAYAAVKANDARELKRRLREAESSFPVNVGARNGAGLTMLHVGMRARQIGMISPSHSL